MYILIFFVLKINVSKILNKNLDNGSLKKNLFFFKKNNPSRLNLKVLTSIKWEKFGKKKNYCLNTIVFYLSVRETFYLWY